MVKLNPNHIRLNQSERLYQCPVPIVAITGSIATGKSSVTNILRQKGHSVIDADSLIKDIYSLKDVTQFVEKICPDVVVSGKIDFKLLRAKFFNDKDLAIKLEKKLYSFLHEAFNDALKPLLMTNPDYIFYDVPLLFEKNIADKVDMIVTVYTPREIQMTRLLNRDHIDRNLANKLINSQLDIEHKKRNSHLIIDNSLTIEKLPAEVEKFLQLLEKK